MKHTSMRIGAAVIIAVIMLISACGTQKMGCPGQITKAPQSTTSNS